MWAVWNQIFGTYTIILDNNGNGCVDYGRVFLYICFTIILIFVLKALVSIFK